MMGAGKCSGQHRFLLVWRYILKGKKRIFYLDLANHIAKQSDCYQTYAAVLLLEYVESIGSCAAEKRRSMLVAYVQAYEEEIGAEFADRIYAFVEEK